MTATVTHNPKSGATLTGAEYEATNHHVVSITAADVGAAASGHDHDADYEATGAAASAVSTHEAAGDPHPGYLTTAEGNAAYAAIGHSHAAVSGAGVPSGAPTGTQLPIAVDTGTGYVYLWNGSVWLEVVTAG